jgi:aryl carrier-like protein
MFCRTPDALTTGGTLLGRGRGSIRGMALQQKMST